MRSRILVSLLLLAAAVGLAVPARSAVVRLLYLDDIAADSAVIVQGTILSSSAAWNAEHNRIYTTYQVSASRYVKGYLGEVFELQEPGGVVDNVQMTASGTPVFQPGEQVLLMLWSDALRTRYQCIGLGQGVLRIRDENGVLMVDHTIPVRPDQASLASALTPFATTTSRQLNLVLGQLSLAVAQTAVANRAKEAQ